MVSSLADRGRRTYMWCRRWPTEAVVHTCGVVVGRQRPSYSRREEKLLLAIDNGEVDKAAAMMTTRNISPTDWDVHGHTL